MFSLVEEEEPEESHIALIAAPFADRYYSEVVMVVLRGQTILLQGLLFCASFVLNPASVYVL